MGIYRHLYAIIPILISLTLLPSAHPLPQQADCSRASYTRCVSLADPLLKDAALIFPDNMADIELVCLTWNSFVDCLKGYTERCFTREQRRQFNKAVENPIESVHMMCTQQHYQQTLTLLPSAHPLPQQADCSRASYTRCVSLADPLLKDAALIFPDNMADIELVCLTWNSFVDCLKGYTERCFTREQRRQFNKAVENPIESVHMMCTQQHYQQALTLLPSAQPLPQQADCSRASYTRCVSLADPLLKDAALIFPDNMADIELVCLTWNSFVDCPKGYTERCFTREQRRQFNKAVENPIESVHMMCMQQHYQQTLTLLPSAQPLPQQADCSRASYTRCVSLADPLLKDAALIFPDNMADIELVCLTWNSFVDCLKGYTERCFTREQRRQFNKAVENPIESVHIMCTQQHYQHALTLLPSAHPLPQQADCSRASYTRCVSLADPLLKDAALIFPDNMADIELVCLTWNSFVDCLKGYTERCFTREQRRQFNKAVENPIESVHMMCTQQHYQQEYLQHASCIKSTVTEHAHCGDQYTQLVDQVSQGEAISRASLCCSHDRFRRCVMREAQRMCDRGVPNGNAVRFAEQIIDKALSFLQDQCYNYIPNSGDCLTVSYKSSDDQLAMSTSPWFSTRGRDIPSSASNPHYSPSHAPSSPHHSAQPLDDALSTDVTVLELGGGDVGGATSGRVGGDAMGGADDKGMEQWMPTGGRDEEKGDTTSGTMLGSRTRPSSYGRSSSWDTSPGPTPPSRPDWATLSTWHVHSAGNTGNTAGASSSAGNTAGNTAGSTGNTWTGGNHVGGGYSGAPTTNLATNSPAGSFFTATQSQVSTTETWYPAAGSHVGNAVDEPNQLGLAKPKNAGAVPRVLAVQLSFTVVATVLVAYC